ncbi:MAG TPA: Kazal-type serine protease inhibitor [Candidatus Pacearchaeota archaeon]|nr:Kazal-type serine protease inhibitor [Candidatus Pacearchaeota archaeon]HQM24501.1 Kazal-type serine protease inhibitor [Candidatus Pacearchaeota archaeon]
MKLYKIILILILISVPLFSFALENDYTGAGFDPAGGSSDLLSFFIKMAIGAGVVIAVLAIIYNGINIIIAQGETAKIIMAKQRMFSVFIGLCILLGVYVISVTINPNLAIIDLKELEKIAEGVLYEPVCGKDGKTYFNKSFADKAGVGIAYSGKCIPGFNIVEFQEIPLGSIVESILAANSSKRIEGADDITGELCYAYDENGDTIDRNGDGTITEEDTLRGVDMFYCLEELNNAIVKKISALNADYLCNKAKNTDGPMRTILNTIKEKDADGNYNCNCNRCATSLTIKGYTCKFYVKPCCYIDGEGTVICTNANFCDNNCSCCGSAYYEPNTNCQIDPDIETYDPCNKEARDKIDCARNEIKIRVDGESYDDLPPGAEAANCPFTAFWEDPATDKEKFLTLKLAETRMKTFEQYYLDHLEDLKNAINMMRDPYGERLSMAEFQSLKGRTDDKLITAIPFVGVKGNTYDPVKYCEEYNCTELDLINDVCISGERAELTDYLYQKEGEFDPNYNIPDFKDRRICSVDTVLEKEKIVYSGDGATFYFKEGFKYEESYDKEPLRMVTDIGEMGYIESEIPLGEMVNDAKKFADKLLEFTGLIKEEINNAKIKSLEFADLARECDCSRCSNGPTWLGSEFYPVPDDKIKVCGRADCVFDNTCDNCSTCDENTQKNCVCCEECETMPYPDTAYYYCMGQSTGKPGRWRGDWLGDSGDICTLESSVPSTDPSYNDTLYDIATILKTEYVASYQIDEDGIGSLLTKNCICPGDLYYRAKILWDPSGFGVGGLDRAEPVIYNGLKIGITYETFDLTVECDPGVDGNCYFISGGVKEFLFKRSTYSSTLTFKKDSSFYNHIVSINPGLLGALFYQVPIVNAPYWPFQIDTCTYEGGKTIVTVAPQKKNLVTICEGEEALTLTEADKILIESLNPGIKWIEGEDAIDLGIGDLGEYCCTGMGIASIASLINLPADYNARCDVELLSDHIFISPEYQHKLIITKIGISPDKFCTSERGKTLPDPTTDKDDHLYDYYVCPYNDLKDKQCRIFNYSEAAKNYDYPEDYPSGLDCRDTSYCSDSDTPKIGLGHLQKIELLAKRIKNYGEGKNLRGDDSNRWISLDLLNLVRRKLDKCITGYGLPLKEGAKDYTLYSCEEGIDSLASGSVVVYPSFPYPASTTMWNCQPYNSEHLDVTAKEACFTNKQHPTCVDKIYEKNLLDDYYCLQRQN